MNGIPKQLSRIPEDTSHIVLSIGGNDGLRLLSQLQIRGILNPLNIWWALTEIRTTFREKYAETLDLILKAKPVKLMVMTIYYPNFKEYLLQKVSCIGIYVFNYIIRDECQVNITLVNN
jgi:hypothetical protein